MVRQVPVAEVLQLPALELGRHREGVRRPSLDIAVRLSATTSAAGFRAHTPSHDGRGSGAHQARCREAGQV